MIVYKLKLWLSSSQASMSSPWTSSMSTFWTSDSEAASSLSLSNLVEDGSLSGSKSLRFALMATNFSTLDWSGCCVLWCVCSQTRTSCALRWLMLVGFGGWWRQQGKEPQIHKALSTRWLMRYVGTTAILHLHPKALAWKCTSPDCQEPCPRPGQGGETR